MGDAIRIMSRRMVRPEPATSRPPETIHLTPWDLRSITVEHIQKGVLLPNPPAGEGEQHLAERLASSFARALGRFYPFAGRLAVAPASNVGGERSESLAISLLCNGEGAEFIHAVAPGVTVADISGALYTPRVVWFFFPLDGELGTDAAAGSGPLLAAQVTELDDGVFVAMSLNHGVADGTTFWHIFNTWSEISRQQRDGHNDITISTPLPVLSRWFLDDCPVPIPLPFRKLEDMVGQRPEYRPVEECFLHFSAESVRALKAKANTEMAGTTAAPAATISSLQALLAHLWRAVCRARGLAPDQETAYGVLAGCRGRLDGGVPASYAGNAVSLVVAKSPAGEIRDKGLGWAAWLLNRAVSSLDEASERDKLASWPEDPSFARPSAFMGGDNPTWVITGSSPRFDVYGNDFGWGAPVGVRSGAGNKVDGKATVYEGVGGAGSMALEVCLAPGALDRLVTDEEFMGAVSPTTA